MGIKTYIKGSVEKLSDNFRVSEFACHGCGCCETVLIDEKLVEYLQRIREHFGAKVTITSGYRCAAHNKAVGGAAASYHTKGMSADIKVSGVKPAEVAKYAESIGVLGIGLYETDADGYFVHIDTRESKSFWYGQSQARRSTFGGAAGFQVKMRTLERGCAGEDVRALQLLLIGNGYGCGSAGADGKFRAGTENAVKAYQSEHGLDADGIAGAQTLASLLGVAE